MFVCLFLLLVLLLYRIKLSTKKGTKNKNIKLILFVDAFIAFSGGSATRSTNATWKNKPCVGSGQVGWVQRPYWSPSVSTFKGRITGKMTSTCQTWVDNLTFRLCALKLGGDTEALWKKRWFILGGPKGMYPSPKMGDRRACILWIRGYPF